VLRKEVLVNRLVWFDRFVRNSFGGFNVWLVSTDKLARYIARVLKQYDAITYIVYQIKEAKPSGQFWFLTF